MAHVPIVGEGNDHIETAQLIEDPTKSWVVYDHLDGGREAKYYRLEMDKGEILKLDLFVPERSSFVPGMVVMGPGIESSGIIPSYVEVPDGAGAVAIGGIPPETAEYEPFTPSALYSVVDFTTTIKVPGTYFIVVHEPDEGGNFGLAIGFREEFSFTEWLLVPLSVIGIHLWEGQSIALVLAPTLITLIVGFGLLIGMTRQGRVQVNGVFGWLGVLAGLLFIGSGGNLLLQIVIAANKTGFESSVVVTLLFALFPVILGLFALRIALESEGAWLDGVKMVLVGLFGLILWAGIIIAPLIAILAGAFAVVKER